MKQQAKQDEKGRQARLDKDIASGKRTIDATPASFDEMVFLSKKFNGCLEDPAEWRQMFGHVDDDNSGKITYLEFQGARPHRTRAGPFPRVPARSAKPRGCNLVQE